MKAARDESRPDAARGRIRIKSCGLPIQVTSREVSTGESCRSRAGDSAGRSQAPTPRSHQPRGLDKSRPRGCRTAPVSQPGASALYRSAGVLRVRPQAIGCASSSSARAAPRAASHRQRRICSAAAPLPSPIARRPRSDGRHDHRYASEDEADGRLTSRQQPFYALKYENDPDA